MLFIVLGNVGGCDRGGYLNYLWKFFLRERFSFKYLFGLERINLFIEFFSWV